LTIIIVSSYGVGSAPLGAYRFRELCDAWSNLYGDKNDNPKILDGCQFAMCGLGDSKFPTFFENPTKMNESLMLVGAKRVGPLGKADASGTGKEVQANVIDRWMDGIWPELATVVAMKPLPEVQLKEMQNCTVELMKKINPDFMPEKSSNTAFIIIIVSFLIGIVAVLAGYQSVMMNKN
jgi:sulfite reductase alpha subunit-like flavoprotein